MKLRKEQNRCGSHDAHLHNLHIHKCVKIYRKQTQHGSGCLSAQQSSHKNSVHSNPLLPSNLQSGFHKTPPSQSNLAKENSWDEHCRCTNTCTTGEIFKLLVHQRKGTRLTNFTSPGKSWSKHVQIVATLSLGLTITGGHTQSSPAKALGSNCLRTNSCTACSTASNAYDRATYTAVHRH